MCFNKGNISYLCVILDLYKSEPVSWEISSRSDAELTMNAMNKLAKKRDLRGSISHSDRGVQYTSKAYVALLEKLGIKQSMSRKGDCWDNAVMESFFSHYKSETIRLMNKMVQDEDELRRITEEYMDYYIHERPQSRLNGLSPSQYK